MILKTLSTMKETLGKEIRTSRGLNFLTRETKISLEELFHQEGFSQQGTKISSLVIILLVIIMVKNK